MLKPQQADELYRETEGNPLFVVEMVRTGDLRLETGDSHSHSLIPDPQSLPRKVQAVIVRRLDQLSPNARDVAGLAATIGREFSLNVLSKACDQPEDTLVGSLDELSQRRIVREPSSPIDADTYDFSHDRIREAAYNSLSTARRRLLHRHVAEALEQVHACVGYLPLSVACSTTCPSR